MFERMRGHGEGDGFGAVVDLTQAEEIATQDDRRMGGETVIARLRSN